ncbi:MAG TPA: DNA repair protein RecN [Fibrobacteria bacterium]|nr:DNA repair protein RecN [Fibrobacteria bacterium]
MLRELKIRNLAIIESADLEWGAGFTAVTGETGAGKSILLNALKFILGAKVKSDLIRRGADKLRVEAVFDVPPAKGLRAALERLEIDPEGGDIVLERELTAAGKNRCRVNGSVVTAAALEEIGSHLVDLHGQHHQQSLIDPATHLGFLDGFAKLEGQGETYHRSYRAWKDVGDRLRDAEEKARRVREQYDFLKFQWKELDKAPLAPGEEERIESELKMQSSLEKIGACLQSSLSVLEGEEGDVLGGLARLEKDIRSLGKLLSPNPFEAHLQALDAARDGLADLRGALRAFRLPQSADSARLDDLNAKLALIQKLKAKYHADMAGLVELRDRRKQELEGFENSEADIRDLKAGLADALAAAVALAEGLSRKRHEASRAFDQEVNRNLQGLGMEGAVFETRIRSQVPAPGNPSALSSTGYDQLEFFLASNPGEPAKPLKQIASGGEISRIMLAIKSALAQSDPRPLLVFDELDTGIGGVTANRVGESLKELAGHHQLIVITHLHQVAAQAARQQKVVKEPDGGRTVTRVIPLSAKERVQELARMMGDENSQATLKHARELLAQA